MVKSLTDVQDAMWQAGYCDVTIASVSEIGVGPETRAARLEWMRIHTASCTDCNVANIFKGIEYRVAEALGATDAWDRGEDVMTLPGASAILRRELNTALIKGEVTPPVHAHIGRVVVQRAGKPWPGIGRPAGD